MPAFAANTKATTAAKAVPRPSAAKKLASVALASVTAAAISLPASAIEVKMGGDDGTLAFVPADIKVKAGEEIKFVNNAGFPHNIVFDEDEVPEGVNADALSAEDYLNSKGETVVRKLDKAGTYQIYCEPHSGAGMKATITVS